MVDCLRRRTSERGSSWTPHPTKAGIISEECRGTRGFGSQRTFAGTAIPVRARGERAHWQRIDFFLGRWNLALYAGHAMSLQNCRRIAASAA